MYHMIQEKAPVLTTRNIMSTTFQLKNVPYDKRKTPVLTTRNIMSTTFQLKNVPYDTRKASVLTTRNIKLVQYGNHTIYYLESKSRELEQNC